MPPSDAILSYLEGGDVPAELGPADARELVDALVERRDAARLQSLASSGGAKLAKEARRGLHALRSRGVDARVPEKPREAPVTATVERAEAWAAPPDGAGERLVSILRPAPGGGFDLAHVRFSDETGLGEVASVHGPKKIWRSIKKRFDESGLVFAEVPLPHAAGLVEEAYQKTLSLGRSPPQGFAAARNLIGVAPAAGEHPALTEVLPAPTLASGEAAVLHDLPDLRSWMPSREILGALRLRLDEVDTSQLLVDDRQRFDARRAAVDQAVEATFDAAGRERWRRRLLDAAHIYHRAGHVAEAARLRAQADRLAAPAFSPLDDPFARAMVEKLLPPELLGPRIEKSSLITTP